MFTEEKLRQICFVLVFAATVDAGNIRNASDIVKKDVVSRDPNAYFDSFGTNVSLEHGLVITAGSQKFLTSCQFFHNVKIGDACITAELTKEYWTDFISVDRPTATNAGDNETIANILSHGVDICGGAQPLKAVCKVKGVEFSRFGQDCNTPPDILSVLCSPNYGLVCLNAEQTSGLCHDYEIQFLCPSTIMPSTVKGNLITGINGLIPMSQLFPIWMAVRRAKWETKRAFVRQNKGKYYRFCFTKVLVKYSIDCVEPGELRQYYEIRLITLAMRGKETQFFISAIWIEGTTLKFLRNWFEAGHAIETKKQIGGNEKTGKYYFGSSPGRPPLCVTAVPGTLDCLLMNVDMKTINNGGSSSTTKNDPHKFNCAQENAVEVNGAFSPLNDAHGHATTAIKKLKAEFGEELFKDCLPMSLLVHYQGNCDGAWWNHAERRAMFCDGNFLYPLASDFNVVTHEIFHCVVIERSSLSYVGEPGCIHEAMTDITAEWVEFATFGQVDWVVAGSVTKAPINGIRNFKTPSVDGRSIDNFSQYEASMDVHYCSGLYNRIFFILSNMSGWTVTKAYFVFFQAHFGFFKRCTSLRGGVCHLEDSATALSLNKADVTKACLLVGLTCKRDDPLVCK